jgi:hypothetical protein
VGILAIEQKFSFPVPESDSGISFSKFSVKWRIMQFFCLLCSQFRQKASSWINKTLLLVKQQKWLSEFCVKMHRVASKNSEKQQNIYWIPCNGTSMSGVQHNLWVFIESIF